VHQSLPYSETKANFLIIAKLHIEKLELKACYPVAGFSRLMQEPKTNWQWAISNRQ
jgi:hypothetical protein